MTKVAAVSIVITDKKRFVFMVLTSFRFLFDMDKIHTVVFPQLGQWFSLRSLMDQPPWFRSRVNLLER